MRMWNVDVKIMCKRHLLGEHVEMHMFKGSIEKGKQVVGYVSNKLVNLGEIKERHDILEKEMLRRGMNHNSPLDEFNEVPEGVEVGIVIDKEESLKELLTRCKDCRRRYEESKLTISHSLMGIPTQ